MREQSAMARPVAKGALPSDVVAVILFGLRTTSADLKT